MRHRHFATRDENAAMLGAIAARRAVAAADLTLSDIDCVVGASGTMDQAMPSNAVLMHRELRLSARGVPAFDVGASCLSFLAAIDTLSWPVVAGRYRHVLIVASDLASCGLDWDKLESSAIFGDGAAAAVIGLAKEGESSAILASDLRTFSDGASLCQIPAGGSRHHPSRIDEAFEPLTKFRMDGKGVFKLAAAEMPPFIDRMLSEAGMSCEEFDWIVPHQASRLAIVHLRRRLGFSPDKVIDIFAEHGNQVGASLPTALDIAIRDGRIRRGHRVLLVGTGAGLSLGGIVLEY